MRDALFSPQFRAIADAARQHKDDSVDGETDSSTSSTDSGDYVDNPFTAEEIIEADGDPDTLEVPPRSPEDSSAGSLQFFLEMSSVERDGSGEFEPEESLASSSDTTADLEQLSASLAKILADEDDKEE